MTDERPHEYGPSRVGHGEAQCIHCLATNRENAVISPNHCSARPAPSIVTGSDERAREVLAKAYEAAKSWPSVPRDIRAGVDRDVSSEIAINAMIALAASRPTEAGAGDWRCKGCGWVGKDAIGMDHPQNGCDLELMRFHLATPKPPVDERERCAKVADDAAEGARVLHNAAAKDRDRDGTLVHGEAWRVAKQIAHAIRNLTGDGADV